MDTIGFGETSSKDTLKVFKKVGFVYPGKDSFHNELGFCVKDQKLIISGKINVSEYRHDKVMLSFTKKKRYKKVFGLDESSEIEVFEESILFGYNYEVVVPKNYITLVKSAN